MDRRVDHLLHAMQHQRTGGAGDIQQALDPKYSRAVPMEQACQPDAEGAPIHLRFDAEREGLQVRSAEMPVGVFALRVTVLPFAARRRCCKPVADLVQSRLRVEHALLQQSVGGELRQLRIVQTRRRVHHPQPAAQPRDRSRIREIGFGNDNPVGKRRLPQRFAITIHLVDAENAIDSGDDIGQPDLIAQHGVAE